MLLLVLLKIIAKLSGYEVSIGNLALTRLH